MKNVLYQAKQLSKEIRHCNEYNQYIRTKSRIMEDAALFDRVCEFRMKSMQLQADAVGNAFEEVVRLRDEYYELLTNPLVNDFLVAEQRVCQLMRRVENTIFDELEFDISFL